MIQRALEALEEQSLAEREITSLTLCIDPSRITEAKEYLVLLRESFRKRFEVPSSDGVFQLNLQFFEHTRRKIPGKESPCR